MSRTSTRNLRSSYHRGNVRADLIAMGKSILETEDLSAVTLRRLTREIGVNPTNFYNHFPNMDYLFAAIKVDGFIELLRRSRKATKPYPNQPDALRALFREYIFFAIRKPNLYRLMFDYYLDFDEHKALKEITDQTMADVVQLLYGTDIFDPSDALRFYKGHPMAVTCWSTMHGLTHILIGRQIRLETKSQKEVADFADSIVDVLLDGVLARTRESAGAQRKTR
jgi:AcrR family transcriptional regulator